ncbi:RlpA-like protein precursor [compost metagenome]
MRMEPALKSGSIPCGSQLARDSGPALNTKLTVRMPIASKLAPTFVFGSFQMKRLLGLCALLSLLAGCASTDTVDPHGYDKTGVASYYGAKHQGKRTANGERFNMNSMTAAHRQLPFGTRVKVTNLNNDKSCVVRINDRGPHTRGRLIDLSKEAAERLGMLRSGTARVRVQALDD